MPLASKLGQIALGYSELPALRMTDQLLCWQRLDLIRQINQAEARLNDIYADPNITDPESCFNGSAQPIDQSYKQQRAELEPLAEAILQDQVS